MKDNEIIKALECCIDSSTVLACADCPLLDTKQCLGKPKTYVSNFIVEQALDLINRQKAEIADLTYKIVGIMHSVDKWLDGAELKKDEVNRAMIMREKTLQITEKQQAEIEQWKEEANRYQNLWCEAMKDIKTAKSEAVKEFAERLIDIAVCNLERKVDIRTIDTVVAELTEQKG